MWGMTLEEEVIALRAEVASLKQQLAQSLAANARLQARLDTYQSEPPSFIKPNTPKSKAKAKGEGSKPPRPRRKRAKDQNGSRRRDTPTRTVEHRLEHCPECGYGLRHPTLAKRRQVIELPY